MHSILILLIWLTITPEKGHAEWLDAPASSAAVHNSEDLAYLGLFRNPRGGTGTLIEKRQTTTSQQTSYYFLSQNSAAYYAAESDCEAYLGEDATLLYIETQEELKAVTKFLSNSDDTGASYWIGMSFDTERRAFVWGHGGELGPWGEQIWDVGHPETRTSLTRVSLYTVGVRSRGGLKLRTQLQTVSNRYICELKVGNPSEEALPCYRNNDLAVVIDGSDGVPKTMYHIALEFATRMAIAWGDNPDNRVTIVVTSKNGQAVFGLTGSLTVSDYRDKIPQVPYMGGSAGIWEGVRKAISEFKENDRATPKNLVILTASPLSGAEGEASKLKESGINTFAVGVGSSVSQSELLAMVGGKPDRVVTVESFEKALMLLQGLSRKVCSGNSAQENLAALANSTDHGN